MEAFPFKDYQERVLSCLEHYLDKIKQSYSDKADYCQFQQEKGRDFTEPDFSDYLSQSWTLLKKEGRLPVTGVHTLFDILWQDRLDGLGRKIPNICLKVPTGGGKTILSVAALQRINRDYFGRNTGLVLWIVPTESIYSQTLKGLRNREHPYRMQLDIASGGQTKILERNDVFTPEDAQNNLCVMILMLQSFNVGKASKDARKVFSDSGRYSAFFPDVDDYNANNALINQVSNLVEQDMLERDVIQGLTIKHSLGNVFKLLRPIVIIDEEHKAKSVKAIDNINQFNPRFILELSATPRDGSNKLVDVGGQDLRAEHMIKLPIKVETSVNGMNWQTTLDRSVQTLDMLAKDAVKNEQNTGVHIRPIMVIIAEPKKKDDPYDHVSEIKKHLIDRCQVPADAIKIKLSGHDELAGIDLMSPMCPVRYIITKDALREGWDCPFAYVLTILAQKDSAKALTQYVGRVLRQPYAKRTPIDALNQSYIHCHFANVGDSVGAIKSGLEKEGLGDVANAVMPMDNTASEVNRISQNRRNDLQDQKIFIPKLTTMFQDTPHKFDYYRDVLAHINWSDYTFDASLLNILSTQQGVENFSVSTNDTGSFDYSGKIRTEIDYDPIINLDLMTSQLIEKIPNPFEAYRIIQNAITDYRTRGATDQSIANESALIVGVIKKNAFAWMLEQSENLFKDAVQSGKIVLQLLATPYDSLNWEMGDKRDVTVSNMESPIRLDKNAFQPQYKSLYNGLEIDVAMYINAQEAVTWWHRLGVKGTEYHVQGWKRDKIYPDFLIHMDDNRMMFVETKGNHLKNDDTDYKKKVFDCLTQHGSTKIGAFEIVGDANQPALSFHLLYDDEWKQKLREILPS